MKYELHRKGAEDAKKNKEENSRVSAEMDPDCT
jgi:hypothetical protein